MKATISSFRSTSTLNTDFLPLFLPLFGKFYCSSLLIIKAPKKCFRPP